MAPLPKMAPHTAAKHLLLKRYLDRWFPILGKYNSRINYIDGFAGPGEYEDGQPGSPLIAIEAARFHVERGTLARSVNINFIFTEADREHAAHSREKLGRLNCPPQFNIIVKQGEFADEIGSALDELQEQSKLLAPTFAFVDPFGFSGIPFELMARILSQSKCEVYVNIMIEFVNRFLEHPNDRVLSHFPSTFGSNDVLDIPRQAGDRVEALLSLYRRQLKSKARFVGRFDMHGRNDQKTYSLFFASNSPKGFEKMKEANWSVDKGEGGRFSDFEPGAASQTSLLRDSSVWEEIQARFRGQRVLIDEVFRFVIEDTDNYLPTHARSALKMKEQSGELGIEIVPGQKRRKGEYPAGKLFVIFPEQPKTK